MQSILLITSVLVILIGLSAINFFYGISEDYDGYFVVEKAQALKDDGYIPSRSWGFPAYEMIVYPIIVFAGLNAAKFYSLVFSLGSVFVFSVIVRNVIDDKVKQFFGTLAFVLLPITILSSNTILETSQGIFFALLGLLFYMRYRSTPRSYNFYLMAVSLGFAVSTRPDYFLFSASVALVMCIYHRPGIKILLIGLSLWSISALLPYAIYESWPFSAVVVPPDPFFRRFIRALFGIVNLYGVFAIALLAVWAMSNYRRFSEIDNPLLSLIFITFVLYVIRFIMLPDELEYVYILAPLLILLLLHLQMSRYYLILLAFTLFMPNLVQIHLFERADTGDLKINVGISPGAIAQERNKRLLNEYRVNELSIVLQQVAERYGYSDYVGEPTEESGVIVVIPDESLRYYRQDRWGGIFYDAVCNQTVVVYPMPENRAWRQFIKFEDWQEIEFEDFKQVAFPHCS